MAGSNSSSNNSIHNEGGNGGLFKPKMGCVGLFPSALNSELKNRLKKSTHASVANLKKSKSNILDSTTFSSNNDNNNNTSLNKNNNNENNSSHDSSSDSDNIVPSKNLAQALRNLSSSSTTSQSAFAGVDNTVDRINDNNNININNSDDTKSLISNLQNFDKTIKEQIQQQHHSSTSEGESSGGREISEIIKNSAIARRKKYSDG